MVCPSLVVGAWLLQHLVEDGPFWGPTRPFALHGGDEIVIEILPLEWSGFLLLFVLLGSSIGALVIIGGRLAFPSIKAEEGADRFFPYRVVCYYVHQLVEGSECNSGPIPAPSLD